MLAYVQMTYGVSSTHVQCSSHRKSRADNHDSLDDVTMIACAIWGGKYIRRAHLGFGAVIWFFGTEWLGLLLSHQPPTVAILVPLMEQEYIQDELSSLFIDVHAPRHLGNTLVSMTLVVWQLVG